jgi:hypothetical protein
MIIVDERGLDLRFFFDNIDTHVKLTRNLDRIQAFLETYHDIENSWHPQLA